jgi:hypothetical protein
MGIKQSYRYKVLPALEKEGEVIQSAPGGVRGQTRLR